MNAPLERAGQWFLHSGIQSPEGGVARYYRSDIQKNNPVSTEITGYTASALVYLHQRTGDPAYAERALQTARFLTRVAWDPDLRIFPFEYPERAAAYFFDCGIIARGLLAVWRMSGEREFLCAAEACGNAMLKDFDAGADFHPILALPSKRAEARDARWSRSSGCYQLKAALGWLELSEETGNQRFSQQYTRMLESALETEPDFLPGSGDDLLVMDRLHAYCYFLEGRLPGEPDQAEGIARVSFYLRKIAPRFARSDVYAQLLRVRLLCRTRLDVTAAEEEACELQKFQRADGGFLFGTRDGKFLPYINPVSTAFGMQALEMWREWRDGSLDKNYRLLI